MPGFDKTGPEGKGPMTGGGRGKCGSGRRTFGSQKGVGQGGSPLGGGAGRCWGGGRGRNAASETPQSVNDLSSYAEELEKELKAVKEEIKKNS